MIMGIEDGNKPEKKVRNLEKIIDEGYERLLQETFEAELESERNGKPLSFLPEKLKAKLDEIYGSDVKKRRDIDKKKFFDGRFIKK